MLFAGTTSHQFQRITLTNYTTSCSDPVENIDFLKKKTKQKTEARQT